MRVLFREVRDSRIRQAPVHEAVLWATHKGHASRTQAGPRMGAGIASVAAVHVFVAALSVAVSQAERVPVSNRYLRVQVRRAPRRPALARVHEPAEIGISTSAPSGYLYQETESSASCKSDRAAGYRNLDGWCLCAGGT